MKNSRQWLANYANVNENSEDYLQMMDDFKYACSGKKFMREEMDEENHTIFIAKFIKNLIFFIKI